MLGYVRTDKQELRLWEYEVYRAYYCGLCKSLKKYGVFAPYLLSYDTVFLALILASIDEAPAKQSKAYCMYRLGKVNIFSNEAIAYAAVINVILGVENIKDNIQDGEGSKYKLAKLLLGNSYKRINDKFLKAQIVDKLDTLYDLEQSNIRDVDVLSNAFGELLVDVIVGHTGISERNDCIALKTVFFNLGKWIYTIDAVDDLEDDYNNKSFNPFINDGTIANDLPSIKASAEFALYYPLSLIVENLKLIRFRQNKTIIDNILYGGLLKITQDILEGRKCNSEGSIRNTRCAKRSHR